MYKLYPYFTNDGSVGLFSPADDDIYHSTYGALTEAYEKFILPAQLENFLQKNSEIKILDICFGIGYNTKSFLNFLYNAQIDTDNVYMEKNNGTIYTDNTFSKNSASKTVNNKYLKIYINAIDTDKILAGLSPFVICNKKLPLNYKLPFKNEKIEKFLNKPSKNKIKFYEEINFILLEKIARNNPEIFENPEIFDILTSKKYRKYFNKLYALLPYFHKSGEGLYTLVCRLNAFLHNIYYRYLSISYKKAFKWLKFHDFIFDLKIEDARKILLSDDNTYDFVFLDAFTPAKCPCLWTVDFFKLLFEHLNPDGMILTYSNSAAVRNAFLHAGFCVGKIYTESSGKFTGTVAVKNKSLIKYELSEYDLSLLQTKAGIFYRDENLSGLNEAIIERHKIEVQNSNLISSSQFIKEWKKHNKKNSGSETARRTEINITISKIYLFNINNSFLFYLFFYH